MTTTDTRRGPAHGPSGLVGLTLLVGLAWALELGLSQATSQPASHPPTQPARSSVDARSPSTVFMVSTTSSSRGWR